MKILTDFMEVYYTPNFKEDFSDLRDQIKKQAKKKIKIFKKDPYHPSLNTHKLKGELEGLYSFWVNKKYRVVFKRDNNKAYLLHIGDHKLYK